MPGRRLIPFLFLLLSLASESLTSGELVVVVNARSGIDRLSRDDVINIFMGRYRVLPSGVNAYPVDQPASSELRAQFYRKLVNKEPAEIGAYWARLVFSGKTSPPKQATRSVEVGEWVANHEGGLGYIDSDRLDDRMRVVLELR
jgi:hypothetical protein